MIANVVALPADYSPFPHLDICGNTLINGRIPFEVGGHVPLLVGMSAGPSVRAAPFVWLTLPMGVGGLDWQPLIAKNQIVWPIARHHPALLTIAVDQNAKSVEVRYSMNTILRVHAISGSEAAITELNLTVFGLNIVGDTTGLNVSTSRFSANNFENVGTMIAIGA